MQLFYQPKDSVVGDVIPFYEDGKFRPFYLNFNRTTNDMCWHMLTTTDHLHFTDHSTEIRGGTGSVIRADGLYHLFYCTFFENPKRGYINHAVSTDLDLWTDTGEVLAPDGVIYGPENFRDPFVFYNEEEKLWWMLTAAQAVGRTERNACVGLCVSEDLHHWEFREPFYRPMECSGACECPDLFRIGDWYYLVFSYYCDRFQTVYRMSRSLAGPWITPVPDDSFDTRAFYAAKTVTDGKDRYVYAWNPTKDLPKDIINPENRVSRDCNSWDWAGTMEVHKVLQRENGTLRVVPEPHVDEALKTEQKIEIIDVLGENQIEKHEITDVHGENRTGNCAVTVSAKEGFAGVLLNEVPPLCKLEAEVSFKEGTRRFGIALEVDENYDRGYYINLEPSRNRMEYESGIRMYEDGGKMFPYAVELERPILLEPDKVYKIRVFVQDSLLLVYYGDEIALSARKYDLHGRRFGLFSIDGSARFENIKIFTE